MVVLGDEIKVSIHDAAEALEFENPRGAVMQFVTDSDFTRETIGAEMVQSQSGYAMCVVRKEGIIGLAMKTDPEVAERFLVWFMDEYNKLLLDARAAHTGDENSPTYDNVSQKFAITQIAKEYGMSGKRLNELLCEFKILFKVNKQYVLYSEYQDKGFTTTFRYTTDTSNGERLILHTYWTPKGVAFIDAILQRKGYSRTHQVTIDQRV